MNIFYALLFITGGVAFLTLAAFAVDAAFTSRTPTRRPIPRPASAPRTTPHVAIIHRPDLTQPGELAQHLERVRADAGANSC